MTERDFKQGLSIETLSVPDAAAYLAVSVETVRRLLLEGQIQGFRLSRAKVRIFKSSVSRYLEEQQTVPVYDLQAQSRLHARRQRATRARQTAAANPSAAPVSAPVSAHRAPSPATSRRRVSASRAAGVRTAGSAGPARTAEAAGRSRTASTSGPSRTASTAGRRTEGRP